MDIKSIKHNSTEYEAMIALRKHVLLDPIGIPETYIDQQKEVNDILIGAFEKNELIGCCILTKKDPEIMQLRQMAVRTDLQKKGVGKLILSHCENLARASGYKIMTMNARDAVLEFYRNCGYEVVGDQFTEVNIPHHRMQKLL